MVDMIAQGFTHLNSGEVCGRLPGFRLLHKELGSRILHSPALRARLRQTGILFVQVWTARLKSGPDTYL